MAWTLLFLAKFPDVQARVHAELDAALGREARALTVADLKGLDYLDRVIKESLRLRPSVPSISRELTEDVYFKGYHIKKYDGPPTELGAAGAG